MPFGIRLSLPLEAEDALAYLPRTLVTTYRKGQTIFDESRPSSGLHLVMRGRVKVTLPLENGTQAMVDVFAADDFIGELSLLGAGGSERALALDTVGLMSWGRDEIEEQVERQPRLGIALIQMLIKRSQDHNERVLSFAGDKTRERLARSLLRFARRLGNPVADGSLLMPPLTHEAISQYVGTSREIVTLQMNHFRQEGYLRYSRRGIQVYAGRLREKVLGGDVERGGGGQY